MADLDGFFTCFNKIHYAVIHAAHTRKDDRIIAGELIIKIVVGTPTDMNTCRHYNIKIEIKVMKGMPSFVVKDC